MTTFGSFVAVFIAVAVCYLGYLMINHKGPFKDKPPSSGTGGGGSKPGDGGRPSKK
jgi:hypothetical protein